MALAYTAPTWQNGGGVGISASQLQALSDCMEGLVQGSDKAITNISISGQTITLTFADGSQETGTASGLKGISSIAKTGTSGLVDTYTITFTDGSTSTFTVTNGADGSFYIVTAGIKSTDDPYGNIEYYIGGDFYKNGVLYNQSAFYKVTLVDETEYPPSQYLIDGSSGTFINGHYSTGSIGGIPSGATITTQIFTDSTMATLLGMVKVLIGLRGSEGEQGPQGPAGDDGFSPEVTITTITGGHRVNIIDADHPSGQNFDVMDGSGSGDMQASAYDPNSDVYNAGGIPDYVDNEISTAISGKADKVSEATNGNFAGLDSYGNLTDSGKKASDFLPSNTPIPSTANCYESTDTEETALADDDYFPFYDTSASEKRKTLWSTIKSVLKTYFDTLYATVSSLASKAEISSIGTNETGTTASKAYAVGEHFYKNGKFCTAKVAIAQGATFTLGTNYVEGSISEYIDAGVVLFANEVKNITTDGIYFDMTNENIDLHMYKWMVVRVTFDNNFAYNWVSNLLSLKLLFEIMPSVPTTTADSAGHAVAYPNSWALDSDNDYSIYIRYIKSNSMRLFVKSHINMTRRIWIYLFN